MEYIKDSLNRIIGTVRQDGNKTTVRDFKSGNIVSTYNKDTNKTLDWKNNKSLQGDQTIRFLK